MRRIFKRGFIVVSFLLLIAVSISLSVANSAEIVDFKGTEVDSTKLDFRPDAQIPGTNIKIGTMAILPFPKSFPKVTFEIGNTLYYLEFSKMYKSRISMEEGLVIYKDGDYGIYKNLLVMRGSEGATGFNGWLLLFT